mmetsp:Transcript_24690/g.65673  ORF Transcript_24690/g.65673 Transcript_24690/m.65673 type:complete len:329 (+) Transcript_24690:1598-2584(+)
MPLHACQVHELRQALPDHAHEIQLGKGGVEVCRGVLLRRHEAGRRPARQPGCQALVVAGEAAHLPGSVGVPLLEHLVHVGEDLPQQQQPSELPPALGLVHLSDERDHRCGTHVAELKLAPQVRPAVNRLASNGVAAPILHELLERLIGLLQTFRSMLSETFVPGVLIRQIGRGICLRGPIESPLLAPAGGRPRALEALDLVGLGRQRHIQAEPVGDLYCCLRAPQLDHQQDLLTAQGRLPGDLETTLVAGHDVDRLSPNSIQELSCADGTVLQPVEEFRVLEQPDLEHPRREDGAQRLSRVGHDSVALRAPPDHYEVPVGIVVDHGGA